MDGFCKQEDKINKLCEFKGGAEADLKNIKDSIKNIETNHLVHIYKELKKLAGRPSWIVSFALTALVSFVAVLVTVLLRR